MGASKNKVTGRLNYISKKEYEAFKLKYPNSTVTYEQFIAVLKQSTRCIHDHILENPLGFKLPNNLGYIAVKKFKTGAKYFAVDWVNTLKLGKRVPLTNLHTFGHAFKIEFFKNGKIKPLLPYKMDAHRLIKRDLAQVIKKGDNPYINIDKNYFSKRFNIENVFKK